ncbi:MAG: Ycf66 family protein [Coleofasciculaceae cyanobacterium]
MLAYVLALVIGLGSVAMYMAAFFVPEVHRKNDFIWSGVGLFYALVLWVCAGRITGGVLLGQLFSVTLLGWFAWQTFSLRRALVSPDQQTPLPNELPVNFQGLQQKITGLFKKGKSDSEIVASAKAAAKQAETKLQEVAEPSPTVEIIDKRDTPPEVAEPAPTGEVTTSDPEIVDKGETTTEAQKLVPPKPPAPELVEAAKKSTSPDIASPKDAVIPVEVIAPEVELAPTAEPPGRGDPEDRIVEVDVPNSPDSENPDQPA